MNRLLSMYSNGRLLLGLAIAGLFAPGISAQVPDSILNEDPAALTAPRIPDKIEGLNRAVFKFNDGFYRVALRPIARGYETVVPRTARRGIGNFFRNLAYPTRLVGNLLSGHGVGALKETGRFLINTTAGVGGFVAVADATPELHTPESDLGLAFASWGLDHGTYVVLPIIGPTSLRDGIGNGISGIYLAPTQYLPEWEYEAIATAVDTVNRSPEAMKNYDTLKGAAIDPYVALRDAFSARRAQQAREHEARGAVQPAPAGAR
jgi:phospholipid-binding lipoprotein MlaA